MVYFADMIRVLLILLFGSLSSFVFAQQDIQAISLEDNHYLEDQFYAGVGFNFVLNLPEEAVLRNFSYAIQLGFIKDLPINQKRNFGFGLGVGYGVNSYYSNISATENAGTISYAIVENDSFDRSKFETHAIEFPFEVRWRNSTPDDYKFWRIYGGVKASYLFSRRSKFVSSSGNFGFQNPNIARWQYGATLSFGYNTWNIQLYYALNNLLEEGELNNTSIEIKPLTIGLIFYIL